ncbi:site-specific DNA-methyltransferase [Ferviditalea candida]|uniref:Methyltransferase n=1 Tax=Ferviditalea candida TaxID=3108399 RepID=A0ABU5ZLE6_9BACL|nr:site-specific DNA-methyltransferase [Paenibacillaceae bacterium T2]
MELLMMKIADLKPHPKNPRKHPEDLLIKLEASIREFGFTNPVLISSDNMILAGHARCKAAARMGIQEVPAVRLALEGAKADAYVIVDNKLNELAQWDTELLMDLIKDIDNSGFDVSLTGFDAAEIDELFRDKTAANVKEDNFNAEKAAAEIETPVTQKGDIWLLGRHRLMCGDSALLSDVQKLMDGKKTRFVFTDPPWNVDYGSDTRHPSWKPRQILNDRMSTEEFGAFLLSAFNCMREVSEAGCMTYVVMSAQEWGNVMNALREAGYHWSSTIIWKKDSLVLSRKDYHTQYEPIWYGWLEGTRLCPLKDRKQSDVWEIPRPKVSEEHPTMKPVSLVAKTMLNSSRAGDLALDLFGGSGTTLIAAEQTGRVCFMMELDPKYCDVIAKRYVSQFGDNAAFLLRGDEKIPLAETQIA